MAHFRLDEYDAAVKEWEAGFRARPSPQFLYNIAQAYRLSKQYDKALSFYKKYLYMQPDAPNRAEVENHIAVLTKLVSDQQAVATSPPVQPLPSQETKTPEPTTLRHSARDAPRARLRRRMAQSPRSPRARRKRRRSPRRVGSGA